MTSPLSRAEIEADIASALAAYGDEVRTAWERIRIEPERWQCRAWPHEPGGFWVVALVGDRALWFNEIEEGFNWSRYSTPGTFDEYFCDQTTFAEVLERIAQEHSANARARLFESGVPADLRGPGTIAARQTTYWDVIGATGARYRIHFRDKVEFAFAKATYQSIDLSSTHPLLVRYEEPTRSLYFTGATPIPREVAEHVERAIREASGSWRGLNDYTTSVDGVERSLRSGHGMLMDAPGSVCTVVARVLEASGVKCSALGNAPSHPGKQVLLLDRSYVIASGFAFERHG